jgi:hypothetical protein
MMLFVGKWMELEIITLNEMSIWEIQILHVFFSYVASRHQKKKETVLGEPMGGKMVTGEGDGILNIIKVLYMHVWK